MAPSSSSTRKAARLAQKGKRKRVRFQGGTLFPLVVALVLVLGMSLVVYARASRPENVEPFIDDHWHGAYAFQLCSDTPNVELIGDIHEVSADGRLVGTQEYITSGVHSHDDGVIHWHPFTSRATGRNAQLKVFLDNYGVELTNERLVLPEGGFSVDGSAPAEGYPTVYEEGETQCSGEDAELRVVVWEDHRDPNSSQTYVSSFGQIPFRINGLAVTIAFVPDDVEIQMPPSAPDLIRLGAIDDVQPQPGDTLPAESTEPTESTEPPDSTEPDDSEPEGTTPDTTEADGTETTAVSATTEG